jgi:hypothetical protein
MKRSPLWSIVVSGAVGCSASGESSHLSLGNDGTGGAGGSGRTGFGGSLLVTGDAGLPKALSAHIESPPGVSVELITLGCSNACADVMAVAKGGFPPYTLTWEEGSTNPVRHVCPAETTNYRVSVTDTGSSSGEFRRSPQSTTAHITADVLSCPPDAGVRDADGGQQAPLCVKNPSFEGTASLGVGANFDAAPWDSCQALGGTLDIIGAMTFFEPPAPTDGATYLRMAAEPARFVELVTQKLCEPMIAGRTYSFKVDIATGSGIGDGTVPAELAVYGSAADCGHEELLWTSPPLGASWTTVCATLRPSHDAPYLTLYPTRDDLASTTVLLMDNLVPVDGCP